MNYQGLREEIEELFEEASVLPAKKVGAANPQPQLFNPKLCLRVKLWAPGKAMRLRREKLPGAKGRRGRPRYWPFGRTPAGHAEHARTLAAQELARMGLVPAARVAAGVCERCGGILERREGARKLIHTKRCSNPKRLGAPAPISA